MDDDGEITYETPMFLCLKLINTPLFVFIGERDKESARVWRIIPHSSQVSIYHN